MDFVNLLFATHLLCEAEQIASPPCILLSHLWNEGFGMKGSTKDLLNLGLTHVYQVHSHH